MIKPEKNDGGYSVTSHSRKPSGRIEIVKLYNQVTFQSGTKHKQFDGLYTHYRGFIENNGTSENLSEKRS